MGKIKYLLFAVYGLTLASCNGDYELPLPTDNAICFDNRIGEQYVDHLTRGTATTNDNFLEFGVYAYYSEDGSYNSSTSTPNYMTDVHVTRKSNTEAWDYSPKMYWPQLGSVSFFAYTPYTTTNTNISVTCEKGAPVITYTVPDEVTTHCDLMLSAPALDKIKDNGAVLLTFHHALSCINFEARVNGTLTAGQSIVVTSIKLGKFKNKASCHHEELTAITQNPFTDEVEDKEYSLTVDPVLSLTDNFQQIITTEGNPMLWPQTIDETDILTVTTEHTSATGNTRKIVFESKIKTSIPKMEAGKRYTFNLLFSPFGKLTLTCTVAPWDNETINVPDFD